jgi:hypothetical protein
MQVNFALVLDATVEPPPRTMSRAATRQPAQCGAYGGSYQGSVDWTVGNPCQICTSSIHW